MPTERIEIRTFQKVMNLYLYIPPQSANSPSVIRGMTYGLLQKYHEKNTHREEYIELTLLLFQWQSVRGWGAGLLKSIFDNASTKVEMPHPSKTRERNDNDERRKQRMFIHAEYHLTGITRRELRKSFQETCGDAYQDLETDKGGQLKITETTIAYSRAKNLRDLLTSAKHREVKGWGVSKLLCVLCRIGFVIRRPMVIYIISTSFFMVLKTFWNTRCAWEFR